MGYYIEFVGDRERRLAVDQIVALLCDNGATPLNDGSDNGFELDSNDSTKRFVDLLYADPPFVITVWKNAPSNYSDHWASIRFSWATDPAAFEKAILKALELAGAIGCRIYDGQFGKNITIENLMEAKANFSNTSDSALNFFGSK